MSLRHILFYSCLLGVSSLAWADDTTEAGASTPAAAAAPSPIPAASGAASSLLHLGDISVTGSLRSRLYVWNWFQPAAGENQYQYSGNLLRVNLAKTGQSWDWDAEFAVPFLLGLPAKATDAPPQGALGLGSNYYGANDNNQNVASIFPSKLFLRFRKLGGLDGSSLQVGRFTFLAHPGFEWVRA